MERVTLKSGRERSLLRRHPWIFSGALEPCAAALSPGETVAVASASGEVLGYGGWSGESQIRVRMLSFDAKATVDETYIGELVAASVARRQGRATGRLVNAESDGLPGVVADCYAGWVVCQFTSALAEYWKATIARALMASVPGCRGVSSRRDAEARVLEGLAVSDGLEVLAGEEPPELIEISEGPAKYLVDVRSGHKTGFYLDQRMARAAVGAWAAGREVLNCFCYTGGFGIVAALNGATRVTQVDCSAEALALAKRNAALNGVEAEHVEADVFRYLRACRDARRTFDMIVLDPPKFAESRRHVVRAARGYKDINLLAMKLLRPGGILATFSCSGAMSGEFFERVLAEAAEDARRDFQIIARTDHADDHPVALAFPEGRYLKGVLLRARDAVSL